MKTLRRHPGAVIGVTAFVLVALVLTGMVAGTLSNATRGDTIRLSAEFSDATGVAVGDDVRMAGVKVGRVVGTELVDNLAVVTFDVETTQRVTTSTLASVDFLNLMGQRYIALEAGAGAPDATPLADGDIIPVARTRNALDLTAMFNAFKPIFDTLRPEDINELAGNIVSVLQGQGGTLSSLTQQVAELTSTVVARDDMISQVLDNLTFVSETANSHRTEIVSLIQELGTLTRGLAEDRELIATALDDITDLTGTGSDLLDATAEPVKADIASLRYLLDYLAGEDELLGSVLHHTPLQFNTYVRTLGYGSHLNVYVCRLYVQVTGGPKVDTVPEGLHSERCR
ncbi:MlaD family protein [Nocardioides sp. AE5]|uniref:MlaD family protein n=1 Tax=Nocardioides sp. AE5 TaxID=2962573 RepID=UPI0028814FA6|nr:MlaD family protein [Nocardioides sp. AE5]MDT0202018.1 MlaD family protein [Nocardioides sp. AE5]